MQKITHTITTLDELTVCAEAVKKMLDAAACVGATVVLLSGDLGAGKTTFVQSLGKLYGVVEAMPSPTFGIMKRYSLPTRRFTTLIHMDAYRIETLSELPPLRFEALLASRETLLCIEWGERITDALPKKRLEITLESNRQGVRSMTINNLLQ